MQTIRKFYQKVRRGGFEKEVAVNKYNRAIENYERACKGLILAGIDQTTLVNSYKWINDLGEVRNYNPPK